MTDELYHYGVKGMHWGVRRYQNPDGTRIKGTAKFDTALTKADRAFKEADGARRVAKSYTRAMDNKAAKRQAIADNPNRLDKMASRNADAKREYREKASNSTGIAKIANQYFAKTYANDEKWYSKLSAKQHAKDQARADRAAKDAKNAKKLADAYTRTMDKKAAKRLAKVDKLYEVNKDRIDKINYKSEIKKAQKNSYLDSKKMSDDELRNAVNRMNNERQYRQAVKNDYLDSLNTGQRMVQNTKDRMVNTTVQNMSDPLVRETVGKGSRAVGKTIAKKAAIAAM